MKNSWLNFVKFGFVPHSSVLAFAGGCSRSFWQDKNNMLFVQPSAVFFVRKLVTAILVNHFEHQSQSTPKLPQRTRLRRCLHFVIVVWRIMVLGMVRVSHAESGQTHLLAGVVFACGVAWSILTVYTISWATKKWKQNKTHVWCVFLPRDEILHAFEKAKLSCQMTLLSFWQSMMA